ncbi:signal transduction histidine kinase [Kibdelosporangium banguiense]|uniref:Oxygen sensor histidine kinase NreB n=1 Tax=Kibdelosporangium banguiense TaxID=1365924 RepID=A0ABS4T9Z6_9PSEU|nr:sensor histidine kinase [Kibdelosporangium banguiense]MBP2321139.1 signal transduction histidine kinase [Kibdelosporangium banguiense]
MEQPARITEASQRWFWVWDLFYAVVYVAVVALILLTATAPPARQFGAVAALTAVIPWYALLGRRLVAAENHGWRMYMFIAGVMVCLGVAVLLVPLSSYALFGAMSMIFMSLRAVPAIFLGGMAMFIPAAGHMLQQGPNEVVFRALIPMGVIGTAFSALIGAWINRVIDQSTDRKQLIEQLEASQAEVSRLSHEAGVTGERERLAGEIHDTLAQGFTSIVTLVQAAESELGHDEAQVRKHLALALRTARENLSESRALVAALAPAELTESSVLEAIRRQATRLTEESGVSAVVEVQGERRPLPTGVDVVLLRTVQESLSNVRKHAGASSAEIVLSYQDDSVVLIVSDNGRGFSPEAAGDGFGLRGMRSRVEQVGGTLSVTSSPGAGTVVELEVHA